VGENYGTQYQGLNEHGLPHDTGNVPATEATREDIIEAISSESTKLVLNTFLGTWLEQMGENSRLAGPDRKPVSDYRLPMERDKETVIILGPGASQSLYTEHYPAMRENATIVTSPTALYWAKKNGLDPDIVVTADSSKSQPILLEAAENTAPVFAGTHCYPTLNNQREVYWYTPLMGNGKARPEENEFNWWDIPVMYWNKDLDWNYPSVGCVVNMEVQIVQDLRARGIIGGRRIVLLGVDFGPWRNYRRVPANPEMSDFPTIDGPQGFLEWDGALTDLTGISYKFTLLRLWIEHLTPIYTMSHGIAHEFPRIEPSNIINNDFPVYPGRAEIAEKCEAYFEKYAYEYPRVAVEYTEATDKAGGRQSDFVPPRSKWGKA